MKLSGGLMATNRFHEFLADVDVTSDVPEVWGPENHSIRRRIEGKVIRRGPIWNEYVSFWRQAVGISTEPVPVDGHNYMKVSLLQVEYDVYPPHGSWMNVEEDTIRLILCETFDGSLDEYRQELTDRNRRVEEYISRVRRGEITGNDVRENLGFGREPRYEKPIPPQDLAKTQRDLLSSDNELTMNILH